MLQLWGVSLRILQGLSFNSLYLTEAANWSHVHVFVSRELIFSGRIITVSAWLLEQHILHLHVCMHHPTLSLFRSSDHPPGGLQRRTPNRNCLYSLTAKSSKKGQSSLNRSSSRVDWLQDSYRLSKCQQNAEWGGIIPGSLHCYRPTTH